MSSDTVTVNGRTLRVLNDFVLVHDGPIETKSVGGIIYPGQYVVGVAGNMWRRGKVLAVGEGKKTKYGVMPVEEIKVGDFVLYPRTVGSKIEEMGGGDDRWLRIMDPKQIFMREEE